MVDGKIEARQTRSWLVPLELCQSAGRRLLPCPQNVTRRKWFTKSSTARTIASKSKVSQTLYRNGHLSTGFTKSNTKPSEQYQQEAQTHALLVYEKGPEYNTLTKTCQDSSSISKDACAYCARIIANAILSSRLAITSNLMGTLICTFSIQFSRDFTSSSSLAISTCFSRPTSTFSFTWCITCTRPSTSSRDIRGV